MIQSLIDSLGDTSFKLRAGKIIYGLPARRLYKIAPYGKLAGTVVYAAPMDVYTLGISGVTQSKSYSYGEDVLFIENSDENGTIGILYGIIIGAIPIGAVTVDGEATTKPVRDAILSEPTVSDLDYWGGELLEKIANQFQIKEMSGVRGFDNAHSSTSLPGDYDIGGTNTNLHIDDTVLALKAGKAGIFLNSVYNMFDAVYPLFRKVSAGTHEQLFLINDNFFHLAMRGLSRKETYNKGSSPVFRNIEEFSNYVFGKKDSVLEPGGKEISSIDQRLDGSVIISAANGVSLEKTVLVKRTLIPKDYPVRYTKDAELEDARDIQKVSANKDIWKSPADTSEGNISVVQPPDVENEINLEEPISSFNDGISEDGDVSYTQVKAVIRTLPTGGILLRDAWGSEIRMEGGNIQISAANNVTTIAGRDSLNMCSGMHVVNASTGIQLGSANRPVEIHGKTGVIIGANEGAIRFVGDSTSIETNKVNAEIDTARLKAGTTLIGGTRVVINSTEFIAHAQTASISGTSSGLVLSSGAVLGSQNFVVNGHLSVRKGGMKISNIPTVDGGTDTVNSPKTDTSISVDGAVVASGAIASSEHIMSAEGIYAHAFAAKDPSVGRLKKAPDKVKLGSNTPLDYKIGNIAEFTERIIEYFKEIRKKSIFGIRSKAYAVWQPLFSKFTGKVKISVASAGEKNYIYPGVNFWEKEGLLLHDESNEMTYFTAQTYKRAGAKSLLLNKENSEESKNE